jgi:2-polyprenyl-3-methyl-5-hydroxy-6-metoxy-1,4-benzoquinol methylase
MADTEAATYIERRNAFAEHIDAIASGTFELAAIAIGIKLGLYAALWDGGPATSVELASRIGISERPVREWLEHGAVNGLLTLVADADEPNERRFGLPAAQAEVLLDRDSLAYSAPTSTQVLSALTALPKVLESFRTGEGFAYGDAGDDMRMGEGDLNRPAYLGPLGHEWLPSIDGLHRRLLADPPARVVDVGCGLGWSSIGLALAYPNVRVDGIDLDAQSIDIARRHAAEAGVADRVRFVVADAAALDLAGPYDLAMMLEAFHDMAQPVRVLDGLRHLLAPDGSILIVDMKAGERFRAPGDDLERYLYGWSVMDCLHVSLQGGGRGTGTAMRPGTLRGYALEAGLTGFEILPIEHDAWRFYRLWSVVAPRQAAGPTGVP